MTMSTTPRLRYEGREIPIEEGETALSACARAGIVIPSSCLSGACQSCLVRARSGEIPAAAQVGLGPAKKALGCLLACLCRPTGALELEALDASSEYKATIAAVERLAPTIVRVRLRMDDEMSYRPGQFVTLLRADGLARAYSIASLPSEATIELHVREVRGGQMSGWLADPARVGEAVRLRGPAGECFFTSEALSRPLVMVGVGTGLAPLWGIVRDALAQGHAGPITLLHGARVIEDLYLRGPLTALARAHPGLDLRLCALHGEGDAEVTIGEIDALAKSTVAAMPGRASARAFVCGDPAMVARLKKGLFLAGLSLREIVGDAFVEGPRPAAAL
ncbi:MAG: 2Fe-2S iron-sulfur cluster binding domain-containing protein [Nannocystis sp.]|nr:2Fe-2S iron-sulfur cluster binding domain-containing protein [Nannocystis sp.]